MGTFASTPALEARNLTKRYGVVDAIRGLDVSIPASGIVGLIGPNAAGKSTLIRTWIGFERPTSGEVRIHGLDPQRRRREVLATVAYVPQSPSLYDWLTVADHVSVAKRLRPGFDPKLTLSRLDQLRIPLSAQGRALSGGQRAQVALSIALGTPARVLLLDEPLAHLDPLSRSEFLDVVVDHARRGVTVVLSSHVVGDVEQACDRILILGGGSVLLNETIAAAVRSHDMVVGDASGPGVVATVSSRDRQLTLVTHAYTKTGSGRRPATLDEVVLGYLAAGRG